MSSPLDEGDEVERIRAASPALVSAVSLDKYRDDTGVLLARIDEQAAKIERLRAALRRVLNHYPEPGDLDEERGRE